MHKKFSTLVASLSLAIGCIGCSEGESTPPTPPQIQPPTQSVVPSPEEVIMYEANPRLYGTSNCLRGLTARFDEIRALGTNVLWIMPVCEFGVTKSIGSPYCVKDYRKLDPKYGTLEDMRTLVSKAHEKGMAVILDWIANHTSWDNAWISNKDWYTQDSSGNIIPPAGTGWNDVADLNFNSAPMREAMIDAMKYWVRETDIDGFRCDAADMVPDDFWAAAIRELRTEFSEKSLLMLAEGGKASHFASGFDMNYAWNYYDRLEDVFGGQSASMLHREHKNEYEAIPKGAVKLRFTTNHDKTAYNGTPIEIYGGKQGSLSALAITALMGGAPMLYSSQECAQASALSFFTYYNYNWEAEAAYTREVERLMQLRASESELFTTGSLTEISSNHIAAFVRQSADRKAFVAANVRNTEQRLSLPATLAGTTMKNALTETQETLPSELTLGAYEYCVWIE